MAKYYDVNVTVTVSATDQMDAAEQVAKALSKSDVDNFFIEDEPRAQR